MKKRKLKKYKVGIDSETYAISLVSAPAIEVEAVALAKQEPQQMVFSDDDKHLLISPILIPNKDIYRTNGDFEYYLSFSEESIEVMSRKYMRQMRQKDITLQHEEPIEGVTLIETWLTADNYQDKAHFYGFDVPRGTWMGTFYVDSNDIWKQVKDGTIKGVSVEAMIGLEEEDFSKIDDKNNNDDNMSILNLNTSDFFAQMKQIIVEALQKDETKEEVQSEEVQMAEQEPLVEEPVVEEPVQETVVEEPNLEEPKEEHVVEEPKPQEPQEPAKDNHIEEVLKNMRAEIDALKEINNNLNDKIKSLEKEPSTRPVNANAKNSGSGDNYSRWRDTLRQYYQ